MPTSERERNSGVPSCSVDAPDHVVARRVTARPTLIPDRLPREIDLVVHDDDRAGSTFRNARRLHRFARQVHYVCA